MSFAVLLNANDKVNSNEEDELLYNYYELHVKFDRITPQAKFSSIQETTYNSFHRL